MATAFRKNQKVKVDAIVPQGPVQAIRMDEDGIVYYLISWTDVDGIEHQRWFAEDQLTAA